MRRFSDRETEAWAGVGGCDLGSGSGRHAAGRRGGAAASGAGSLQGGILSGADRRATGVVGAGIGASKVYGSICLSSC